MRALFCYCLLFMLLALMSCRQEADTPPVSPVPAITFKGLTKHTSWNFRSPMGGYVGDSISLTIDYQDGDSDLGYNREESGNLWDLYGTSGINDRRAYNYYLDVEKKVNGVFQPVIHPTPHFKFWGIFPRVELANAEYDNQHSSNPFKARTYTAHHGKIVYGFVVELFQNPPLPDYILIGDTVRCRLQIADRARNLSNTIETPEFVFMK